jgi:hypothetical protein
VPVADAGPGKIISLPDSASLTGTGTDADGKVVAYLWSQVNGPGASKIINPGSPSTKIKFDVPGSYVFQLMVTDDKGATGVDTVSVIVNPSTGKMVIIQPVNNPNEFNLIVENGADLSAMAGPDLPVEAWTRNNLSFYVRSLIKFDLSSISSSHAIVSANLYLYSYPSPPQNGNLVDANYGSNNAMLVQQVSSNWSTATATWYNQPSTTTTNQVIVPTTNQSSLDLNLDVTDMVKSMVSGNNYGFMLKLQNETKYNSRIFVASHHPTATAKYPKLVVVYQ